MLFAAWMMTRRPPPFLRECLAASVPLLIILQIDYGFALTTSEGAAHYQYVIIPTLLYANVSLHRLMFPFARAVTAAVLIVHAAVVLSASYIEGPVAAMILVQIAICAYITLVTNYMMERDLRRAYLYSLRDRLRHSQADTASRRDALTGLANRHHLDIELRRLWAAEAEPPPVVSVISDRHRPFQAAQRSIRPWRGRPLPEADGFDPDCRARHGVRWRRSLWRRRVPGGAARGATG